MNVLKMHRLSKWYGEVIGLNDVTATVGAGITGLLGPNGAGKSTLMGIATGQLRPTKGYLQVMGERVWDNPRLLSRIGYCPEGDRFWPGMTGLAFVRFLAKASGLRGRAALTAAQEAIETTGMTAQMRRPIRTYSKGMRQRIKMAQALAHKPELLILDEPFTGADPVARHDLADLFRHLAEQGVHVLISSHVLHEVDALTKQIIMIDHGRIVAHGSVQQVRAQLHDRPHAIRVRVSDPRAVAAEVAAVPVVRGIKLMDDDTLLIETTDPEAVHDRLTDVVLDRELVLRELAPADESLEALFGYLTDKQAS